MEPPFSNPAASHAWEARGFAPPTRGGFALFGERPKRPSPSSQRDNTMPCAGVPQHPEDAGQASRHKRNDNERSSLPVRNNQRPRASPHTPRTSGNTPSTRSGEHRDERGGGRLPPPSCFSPLPLAPASPRARPPAKVRSSRTPGTGRACCHPPWSTLQRDPHACMRPGSAALDRLPTRPPRFRSATRIPPAWYRRAEGAGGYGARADGEGRAPVRWVPLAKGRGASAGYYAELAAGASAWGEGPGPGVVSRRRRSRARPKRRHGRGPEGVGPFPVLVAL